MTRIVKAGADSVRVIPAAVMDAKAEATRIVDAAKREAEALRTAATADGVRLRAEAEKAGFEQGKAQAGAILLEAAGQRDRAIAQAEMEAVKVALTAAARIVDAELALDPAKIRHIVTENLTRTRRAKKITIRVNPDDLAALSALGLPAQIEPDPSMHRGGCVLRSELGTVDARVETQLATLAAALQIPWP